MSCGVGFGVAFGIEILFVSEEKSNYKTFVVGIKFSGFKS